MSGGTGLGGGGQALLAGGIGGVDEGLQRPGDLAGPDRTRIGLGRICKVLEQLSCAKLVGDGGNLP